MAIYNNIYMTNKNKWLLAAGSALALAATLFFVRKKQSTKQERPSKKAPQLDIENPGSQDDFPKPPMESEVG